MIKILHIINGADLGGISSMLLNYYRFIDRENFHFDFIYSINEPLGHNGIELQKLGANFYYVPKKSNGLKAHVDGIKKILNEGRYDAIHVHSSLTSYVALAVAKHCGVKVRVAHAHNAVKNIPGIKNKLNRWIGNALIRHYATARVACSKDAAIYTFGSNSVNEINTRILPNAIDTNKFIYSEDARVRIRKEFNIGTQDFVLGSVGRMTSEKNQIILLDIFREAYDGDLSWKLLLVGDGDQRKKIEDKAEELGIAAQVIFTGQRSDVPDILNAIDLYLMPSLYEGFPVAGLEAAANGLPIILSDTITKELSFVKTIQYISLEKPEEWVSAIKNGRTLKRDKDALKNVIENGFDISAASKELGAIYSKNQLGGG